MKLHPLKEIALALCATMFLACFISALMNVWFGVRFALSHTWLWNSLAGGTCLAGLGYRVFKRREIRPHVPYQIGDWLKE